MEHAFKRITVPEKVWTKIKNGVIFKIDMPKDSIAICVSCGNGCYMYIHYPKSTSKIKEKIMFFTVPFDRYGNLGEIVVDIPEGMEFYQVAGNIGGMNPVMLFGLKKKI